MTDNITNNDEPRKPAHTPGPWVKSFNKRTEYFTIRNQGGNRQVTAVYKCEDALLIAAAPELLDACQVAIGHLTGGMDGDWRDCDPVAVLRAAIAKALGQ